MTRFTSDTLTYRNLEAVLKDWRWMKLLHGAIHPTTKERGLSCPISVIKRRPLCVKVWVPRRDVMLVQFLRGLYQLLSGCEGCG